MSDSNQRTLTGVAPWYVEGQCPWELLHAAYTCMQTVNMSTPRTMWSFPQCQGADGTGCTSCQHGRAPSGFVRSVCIWPCQQGVVASQPSSPLSP